VIGTFLIVAYRGLVKGVARAPEIDEQDVKIMFDTNVTGLINMTQAVLKVFKKRPEGGAGDIINIGSIAGRDGYPGGSIYTATKAAVRIFTDSLRKELIDTRVRVIEIDPGQVETVWPSHLGLEGRRTAHELMCFHRSSLSSGSTEIKPRPMPSMRTF